MSNERNNCITGTRLTASDVQFITGPEPLAVSPSQLGDYRALPIVLFNAPRFRRLRGEFYFSSRSAAILIRNYTLASFSNPRNTLESRGTAELLIHIDRRLDHRGIFRRVTFYARTSTKGSSLR